MTGIPNGYSCRKASTGLSLAARAAGMKPKIAPTATETANAAATDQGSTGIRSSARAGKSKRGNR